MRFWTQFSPTLPSASVAFISLPARRFLTPTLSSASTDTAWQLHAAQHIERARLSTQWILVVDSGFHTLLTRRNSISTKSAPDSKHSSPKLNPIPISPAHISSSNQGVFL